MFLYCIYCGVKAVSWSDIMDDDSMVWCAYIHNSPTCSTPWKMCTFPRFLCKLPHCGYSYVSCTPPTAHTITHPSWHFHHPPFWRFPLHPEYILHDVHWHQSAQLPVKLRSHYHWVHLSQSLIINSHPRCTAKACMCAEVDKVEVDKKSSLV